MRTHGVQVRSQADMTLEGLRKIHNTTPTSETLTRGFPYHNLHLLEMADETTGWTSTHRCYGNASPSQFASAERQKIAYVGSNAVIAGSDEDMVFEYIYREFCHFLLRLSLAITDSSMVESKSTPCIGTFQGTNALERSL